MMQIIIIISISIYVLFYEHLQHFFSFFRDGIKISKPKTIH